VDDQGVLHLAIPKTEPQASDLGALIGSVLNLKDLGYNIEYHVSSASDDHCRALYAVMSSIEDELLGAIMALSRRKFNIDSNPPGRVAIGVDYVNSLAFSQKFKLDSSHMAYAGRSVKTFTYGLKTAWNDPGAVQIMNRIRYFVDALVKQCTDDTYYEVPKHYLRSKKFFQEKLLGKNPDGTCLTNDEVDALKKYSAKKHEDFDVAWQAIEKLSLADCSGPGSTVHELLDNLVPKRTPIVKLIEEQRTIRNARLQETKGRGKRASKTLVPGANLTEKLVNLTAFMNPRHIAEVLWSPLFEETKTNWQKLIFQGVSWCVRRGEVPSAFLSAMDSDAAVTGDDRQSYAMLGGPCMEAIQCYLDNVPSYADDASWQATFGLPKIAK
jgi:hypothetical protein